MLAVLKFEDLNDVVLIGHSYGGMVATGVADRSEGRVAKLIYLDAFAPRDGQSLFDLVGPEIELRMRQGASQPGDGWKVPPNPMPPDTPAGLRRLGYAATAFAAGQDVRAETAIVVARIAAARLYLLPAAAAARLFRAIRRPRQGRRLALCRHGCEPQSAYHHTARLARRVAGDDRGKGVAWPRASHAVRAHDFGARHKAM